MSLFGGSDEDAVVGELLDGLPVGAVVVTDGRITAANDRACAQLGEDVIDDPVETVVPGVTSARAPDGDTPWVSATHDGDRLFVARHPLSDDVDGDSLVTLLGADRLPTPTPDEPSEDRDAFDRFVHGVSHDLMQPLTVTRGHLGLLDEAAYESNDDAEHLAAAISGLDRAENLLERLDDYASLAPDDRTPEPVDLDAALEEAVSNVVDDPDHGAVDVTIEDLPTVAGLEGPLVRVFQNLLSNAVTYQDEPPYRVRVSSEPDGDRHRVTVADNGLGMETEDLDGIFEPFERRGSGGRSGRGLGLALCRRLVEDLDGRIEVESTPGEGSEFHVWLPTVAEGTRDPDATRAGSSVTPEPAADASSAADSTSDDVRSVVLVDDVDGIRSLMASIMERTGRYEVIGEAGGGAEGIEVTADRQPDLVLLDLSMPEVDGLEALPEITAEAPEATVVIYSGFEADRMREQALDRGADGYIEKGGDPEEILEALESILGDREAVDAD